MMSFKLVSTWRKAEIKDVVLDLLERARIHRLPVPLYRIVELRPKWTILTVDEAREVGIIIPALQRGGGYTVELNGQIYVIYEPRAVKGRIRWTLAHELGHLFLHHSRIETNLVKEEVEANYFAREVLMPIAVLDELGARTPDQIMRVCNVSRAAAASRASDFGGYHDAYKARHGYTHQDQRFLRQFAAMFREEYSVELYAA
ncbi:ImmA/IrrE family metallo-endopeptidase [Gehongia tenuis]|uniref:ImmA/IrrE family metallo-endopeptidase n=1 Tax=Gehongia tenuis TaxID=2763655 RepID=A0A926D5M1_9FIRM|nr:ImmA/IrrE family metallo-endopeptidase [Gehongia tenuis]MBC8532163.1 ImmA/IrrE family metallo-endopeptidase [Gehongia tenuis]